MYILGISALYHDSSACLLQDGKIISAAAEERFTRIKHDHSFPLQAIQFCLKNSDITINEIDLIVFYEKPFLKFDRILNTIIDSVPFGFNFFRKSIKSWTKTKLWIPQIIKKELNYNGQIIFSEHHEAHAAATFFTSPFNESAIITIDGVGEKASITIAKGKDNKVEILHEQHYPNSFGLLYSAFTQYCGFKVNSGEYKLMGLAPYGKPVYKQTILDEIVSISENAEVNLNLKYFSFEKGESTINDKFCELFGKPIRKEEDSVFGFYADIASSIQSITDDFVVKLAQYAKQFVPTENLCMSGGVALNCKANGVLKDANVFKNIWIQPASGDDGTAIGAAFIGWYHYYNKERFILRNNLKNQVYLGSNYTNTEIETQLKKHYINYLFLDDKNLILETVSALIDKKIVGWFQGKMEFGPRALGNRSILANPVFNDMKSTLNLKIKFREGFRPFAPVVLEEKAKDWFDLNEDSKYMLFTAKCLKKETIPSCVHEDLTARVQTISNEDNELFYSLIETFDKKTNVPVLINTSFNVRGEPIVESPEDALRCFFNTHIDVLIIGSYIIKKSNNLNIPKSLIKKIQYELD